MSDDAHFDAIVVGASLAGCTAAMLLAREGARVALVERHAQPEAHKHLCTHFIQPCALPVLQRIGLDRLIEQAGGLRNGAEVHTPWGWIGQRLDSDEQGRPLYGYNIRRLRLDPLLRETAAATPGVSMMAGRSALALLDGEGGRISGIETGHHGGERRQLRARLVIAADGRHSELATLAGIQPRSSPNRRFGLFAAMRKVDLRRGSTSQMWFNGAEAGYIFPNEDGVAVVTLMAPQAQLGAYTAAPLEALKARMRAWPDAPQFHEAELAGPVLTVKDYPCLHRPAQARGMALVGDAMISTDPLWGVGCGWAFQTADWLADAATTAWRAGGSTEQALAVYERRCASLAGHRFLIDDFARRLSFNPIERLMFSAATKDVDMARHVNRFGGRLIGPAAFLAPRALLKAAWVNLRHPHAPPEGTRTPTGGAPDGLSRTAAAH
ncbi:NAD(P)/FAD-dependent oxidoreductase [Pelomonas sp. KK5]|uniref:NAD(P)/FAD-dependent oxidoreductase n=1 Tax=Pelomonas sp. KK5 TaxID=1855730 RepID=UPI0018E9AAA4|nr:NAD(P)/FAD-dependent oxidoreductase [Pelomonas sp. KK5]